jgi:hypothetical protein
MIQITKKDTGEGNPIRVLSIDDGGIDANIRSNAVLVKSRDHTKNLIGVIRKGKDQLSFVLIDRDDTSDTNIKGDGKSSFDIDWLLKRCYLDTDPSAKPFHGGNWQMVITYRTTNTRYIEEIVVDGDSSVTIEDDLTCDNSKHIHAFLYGSSKTTLKAGTYRSVHVTCSERSSFIGINAAVERLHINLKDESSCSGLIAIDSFTGDIGDFSVAQVSTIQNRTYKKTKTIGFGTERIQYFREKKKKTTDKEENGETDANTVRMLNTGFVYEFQEKPKKKMTPIEKMLTEGADQESEMIDPTCNICYSNKITVIYYPCKHACVCFTCASAQYQMTRNSKTPWKCPVCKSEVKSVGRFFLSDIGTKK